MTADQQTHDEDADTAAAADAAADADADAETFGRCLRRLRTERGMSLTALSLLAHYSRGYLSKVENGRKPPTADLARCCDKALGAGGALLRLVPGSADREQYPYPGLAAFAPDDAQWFFGRERATADLMARLSERLRRPGPVMVVGPSGAGKSSLLQAGLRPALARGALPAPGSRSWPVLRVTPGAEPLGELVGALAKLTGLDRTAAGRALRRGPAEFAAAIRSKLREGCAARPAASPGLVVVVDQFEQIFTTCADGTERHAFITTLCALAGRSPDPGGDPSTPILVVLGARADFYGHCLRYPTLVAALRNGHVPLGAMTPSELRAAITGPARQARLELEPGLTELLLVELAGHEDHRSPVDAGALPLLAHALFSTWQQRDGSRMTVAAYRLTGGIRGAIAASAERVYADLSAAERTAARRLLRSLVHVSPDQRQTDTRRRVRRERLTPLLTDPAAAERALVAFTDARLLTLDTDHVDLAHEAVLSAWPRLRAWIDADRAALRTWQRLSQDAEEWEAAGHPPALLYRGTQLALAAESVQCLGVSHSTSEQDFLDAARAAETSRTRARRRLRLIGALLSVLTLVTGATAWQQYQLGRQQSLEAASRQLTARAESLRYPRPVDALRLSVAAWRIHPTDDARSALLTAMAQPEQDTFRPPRGQADDEYHGAHLSDDGRILLSRDDRHIHVWDVVRHRQVGKLPHQGLTVHDLAADGRHVILGAHGRARVYDTYSGAPVGPAFPSDDAPAAFTPTGRSLIVHDLESIRVWDIRRGRVTSRLDLDYYSDVSAVMVSREDKLMAFCRSPRPDAPAALVLHDTATSRAVPSRLSPDERRAVCGTEHLGHRLHLDPSGRLLVSVGERTHIWDLATGTKWQQTPAGGAARFSHDGRFLAVATDDEVLLWRTDNPDRPVFRHSLNGGTASQLRLDLDQRSMRYWADNATVRTLLVGDALTPQWEQEGTTAAQFSPDGRYLATAQEKDGAVRFTVRSTRTGSRPDVVGTETCGLSDPGDIGPDDRSCGIAMSFSADGRSFVYGVQTRHSFSSRHRAQTVMVWDLQRQRERSRHVVAHPGTRREDATGLALMPDGGTLLLRRDTARRLEALDLRSGDATPPPLSFRSHSFPHSPLVVRPDGRLAADSGGLYDLPSGHRSVRGPHMFHGDHLLAFSTDSRYLAAGAFNGRVALWDGDGEHLIADLPGTFSPSDGAETVLSALAFSADGTTLAVGDTAGRIALYDVPSARRLVPELPTAGDAVQSLAFSSDGKTLLVAGEHTAVRSYAIDPERLAALICERSAGGFSPSSWKRYAPDVPHQATC
ncbi:nSTAND1 domain-containing NTPase [Streptomyces roseolus]|uniref:nSTAND1 domain-containing NTPase n=1 Tax=Streptomyces roseolus TaxID=67358 RepID=UPI003649383E